MSRVERVECDQPGCDSWAVVDRFGVPPGFLSVTWNQGLPGEEREFDFCSTDCTLKWASVHRPLEPAGST